eukprot:gene6660-12210_t
MKRIKQTGRRCEMCRRTRNISEINEAHNTCAVSENTTGKVVGDIVLIKNDMQPKNMWKLGKITRTIKGSDGTTRGAELQTMTNGRVMVIEQPFNCCIKLKTMPKKMRKKFISITSYIGVFMDSLENVHFVSY